jgi:hypothetical protein
VDSKRGRMGQGADSSRTHGCRRKQEVRTRTEGESRGHCDHNTCLGADGCDIGHGPQRVRPGANAGMGRAHAAMGTEGYK